MRTVGQMLKEEREKNFYKLEEVEKATKIRKELLEALEEGNWEKLPPPTFIQGFIKNYSKFLGLDSEKLLAVFRREFSDQKHPPKILQAWTDPLDKRKFHITPTKVITGLVLSLIVTFFVYLWVEYKFLVGSPFLEVLQPSDQVTVSDDTLRVSGKTDPEAKITINDQAVSVDFAGNFSQVVKLTESSNTVKIEAIGKSGKTTTEQRTVFLKRE